MQDYSVKLLNRLQQKAFFFFLTVHKVMVHLVIDGSLDLTEFSNSQILYFQYKTLCDC